MRAGLTLVLALCACTAPDDHSSPGDSQDSAPPDTNDSRIDYILAHGGAPVAVESLERIFTGAAWPEVSDHPGMLARLRQVEPADHSLTTVTAEYDAAGQFLALRGDHAPLDWKLGWPASQDGSRWTVVRSEVDTSFEYKWLLDDSQWQLGSNLQGQAGQHNEATVEF